MKFWITGSGGSLGSELVLELKQKFPDVEILAPNRSELDLAKYDQVINYVETHKPTHVFHLAALVFGIAGHKQNPAASYFENSMIDINVLTGLMQTPPLWIYYSSTVAAYGYPYDSMPLTEVEWEMGVPHESEFGYAMSKRHALTTLELMNKESGVKFAYGLTTNLFGKGDRFLSGRGHVVVSLLEKARVAKESDSELEVWGDGTASRDFLSTIDASRIIIDLIDQNVGVVNIASGQELFISDIAEHIVNEYKIEKGLKFLGINQGISNRVCDVKKINKHSTYSRSVDSKKALWQEISKVALS